MKRKHNVFYTITDWPGISVPGLWWNRGDWRKAVDCDNGKIMFQIGTELKYVGFGGASSDKTCYTFAAAWRCAKRLQFKGGTPLLTQWFYRKGVRYCRDYYLKDK
jgi:hypothetical protein